MEDCTVSDRGEVEGRNLSLWRQAGLPEPAASAASASAAVGLWRRKGGRREGEGLEAAAAASRCDSPAVLLVLGAEGGDVGEQLHSNESIPLLPVRERRV